MSEGKKLVPKLRFPEFRDAAAWQNKELGSVCEILNNRRRPITGSDREPGPYPYYGASGIVDFVKEFIFDERLLLVGEDGAKWNAFEKTAFIVEGKYWVNNHAHVLKPIAIRDTLLENYLTMVDLGPFVTGAAPPKLTLGKLKSIPVPVPPSTFEQQKIADCLSSLDELIAAQARKVDALKTHKKGLMQQLFPREGETQPRLRFAEFQEVGGWEESQLAQLTTKISDGIHTTPTYEEDGEYAFINGNNLVNGRILINEKTKRVNSHEFKKHRKPLNANSILMSINGTIGNLAFFRNEEVVLGKSACFINIDISVANRVFIYNLLQTDKVQSVFNAELTGSTIKNLSLGTIKNAVLSVPGLLEQQHIANCLTYLDALITAATQELETLMTHKKGLMQQLFPSVGGVAGEA